MWFDPLRNLTIEKFSLAKPLFEHKLADYLVKAEADAIARELRVVETGAAEIGLRYENGVLAEVLAPNTRRLYWKGYIDLRFEKVNIATEYAIAPALTKEVSALILRGGVKVTGNDGVFVALVPEHHTGVLSVDSKHARHAGAGPALLLAFSARSQGGNRGSAFAGAGCGRSGNSHP